MSHINVFKSNERNNYLIQNIATTMRFLSEQTRSCFAVLWSTSFIDVSLESGRFFVILLIRFVHRASFGMETFQNIRKKFHFTVIDGEKVAKRRSHQMHVHV